MTADGVSQDRMKMPTSHTDASGLTGHQRQLLTEACSGPVTCDGRRAQAARVLLARGLAIGPGHVKPDGTPSTKWIRATPKGRRLRKRWSQ